MRKPPSNDRESPWARARAPRASDANARERAHIERAPAREQQPVRTPDDTPREIRLYGLNACLAAFAKRPEALRKVYLTEARMADLKPVLAWCVKHRLGYRIVETGDLDKLTASRHHEGVCFDIVRAAPLELGEL